MICICEFAWDSFYASLACQVAIFTATTRLEWARPYTKCVPTAKSRRDSAKFKPTFFLAMLLLLHNAKISLTHLCIKIISGIIQPEASVLRTHTHHVVYSITKWWSLKANSNSSDFCKMCRYSFSELIHMCSDKYHWVFIRVDVLRYSTWRNSRHHTCYCSWNNLREIADMFI